MPTTTTIIPKISASTLKGWLDKESGSLAIIDVRDADFIGGHIKSAINVPSSCFYSKLNGLSKSLAKVDKVVFHCQLSQQRGPSCACAFINYLDQKSIKAPQVYVLAGGFSEWAYKYGPDPKVTESFVPSLYR